MWIEIALVLIAIIGYTLWIREWKKHKKLIKALQVLQVAAQNTAKSPFARREAKQIVGTKDKIKKLVKSLERLKVPNDKKREAVLKWASLKMPGVGVGVIDTAIQEALREVRA